jgi:hypothetical protein
VSPLAARARAAVAPTAVELHETRSLVAICAIAAAVVHAVVVPAHVAEGWAHVAFFVVVAAFQFGWAVALLRAPSARLLRAGIWASLAVAGVWLVSRTVGVPVGPEAWTPEPVGALDLATTYTEVLTAAGCGLLLRGADAWRLQVFRGLALTLVVLTLTAAFLGSGHHH